MKKIVYALAILAAASTAAVAKDLKQEKKATAPAVAATQMTDSEMDKVTAAGEVTVTNTQLSLDLFTFAKGGTFARITNSGISRCVGAGASGCYLP
jgi:hypothetical protein